MYNDDNLCLQKGGVETNFSLPIKNPNPLLKNGYRIPKLAKNWADFGFGYGFQPQKQYTFAFRGKIETQTDRQTHRQIITVDTRKVLYTRCNFSS